MGSDKLRKTEHAGPKQGEGAFYGPRKIAKQKSRKIRRQRWQAEIRNEPQKEG